MWPMTFNELLDLCEKHGQKQLTGGLYQYILINFKPEDFDKAAQMMTDLIVDWVPEPLFPEYWVLSTDFAFAQNFAALMRSRGVLPPPEVVIELTDEDFGYEILIEDEPLVTTEYVNDR